MQFLPRDIALHYELAVSEDPIETAPHSGDGPLKIPEMFSWFVTNPGKLLTHRFLLKEVWGPHHVLETPYLRVFMASLRRKIEADPSQPKYLLTEPGVGYRLAAE